MSFKRKMDGGKAMTHMIKPKILQLLQILFHFVVGYVMVGVYIEIIGNKQHW
jgi:hypothetical protein